PDIKTTFAAGRRSDIQVRVNLTDPVQVAYADFLARGIEGAVNRQIIEQAVDQGRTYAMDQGLSDPTKIPAYVIAAPTVADLDDVAPSEPTVVQYFAPAVLALILQHLAVTLIALSVV